MTNEISTYITKAIEVNDALLGLPALPLVFLGCIAWGYVCKATPFVPNKYIPLLNFVFGCAMNAIIDTKQPIGRAIILGLIASVAAWVVHYKWLYKLIDERVFRGDSAGDKPADAQSAPTPPKE